MKRAAAEQFRKKAVGEGRIEFVGEIGTSLCHLAKISYNHTYEGCMSKLEPEAKFRRKGALFRIQS